MNILKLSKYGQYLSLVAIFAIAACKKDKFIGKDNFITSFYLTKDNTVLHASIADTTITLIAPDFYPLENVRATVELSENATIYPDPATITDWSDEILFVVTAHNGTRTTYKYTIQRKSIFADKSVVLTTQADVDAFAKEGITEISGSLIIGKENGIDSVRNLAPLFKLKKIGYSLIINATYAGKDFIGLDNLQSIGDGLRLESPKNLEKALFPGLETVGNIYMKSTGEWTVDCPKLFSINKDLELNLPLSGMLFPNLLKVGGKIILFSGTNNPTYLNKVSFPKLKEAGSFSLSSYFAITKFDCPALVKSGDMIFTSLTSLSTINCPKLQTVTGTITIADNTLVKEVSFPALEQAGGLNLQARGINVLDLPVIKKISGLLALNTIKVDGIKSLTTITDIGELAMTDLSLMTTFSVPSSLQHIGKLSMIYRSIAPPEINVKGLKIDELNLQVKGTIPYKVIGDEIFNGTLLVAPLESPAVFPTLEGFSEVDSLGFGNGIFNFSNLQLKGIKKIKKGLSFTANNIKVINIADLEEVGGNFTIVHLNEVTNPMVEIPKLKKIGGNFDVQIQSVAVTTLKFSALETVGGNFLLGTGFSNRVLASVQFPMLTAIGKSMTIYAQKTAGGFNNKLINLDGFSTLNNVKSIEVREQSALNSFAGLKNAFPSITSSGWITSKNAYNPTYADLASGKWTL